MLPRPLSLTESGAAAPGPAQAAALGGGPEEPPTAGWWEGACTSHQMLLPTLVPAAGGKLQAGRLRPGG